jgi:exodeoxyribonuclease VII large subunit
LKDENAQLPDVCFSWDARSLDFEPQDGMKVIARGRQTEYEVKGTYQLVARTL